MIASAEQIDRNGSLPECGHPTDIGTADRRAPPLLARIVSETWQAMLVSARMPRGQLAPSGARGRSLRDFDPTAHGLSRVLEMSRNVIVGDHVGHVHSRSGEPLTGYEVMAAALGELETA
jgi:hypothetical protein